MTFEIELFEEDACVFAVAEKAIDDKEEARS